MTIIHRGQLDNSTSLTFGILSSVLFIIWNVWVWPSLSFISACDRAALRIILSFLILTLLLRKTTIREAPEIFKEPQKRWIVLSAILLGINFLALISSADQGVLETGIGILLGHLGGISISRYRKKSTNWLSYTLLLVGGMSLFLLWHSSQVFPILSLLIGGSWFLHNLIVNRFLCGQNALILCWIQHSILMVPSLFYIILVSGASLMNLPLVSLIVVCLFCGTTVLPTYLSFKAYQGLNNPTQRILVGFISPLCTTFLAFLKYKN